MKPINDLKNRRESLKCNLDKVIVLPKAIEELLRDCVKELKESNTNNIEYPILLEEDENKIGHKISIKIEELGLSSSTKTIITGDFHLIGGYVED